MPTKFKTLNLWVHNYWKISHVVYEINSWLTKNDWRKGKGASYLQKTCYTLILSIGEGVVFNSKLNTSAQGYFIHDPTNSSQSFKEYMWVGEICRFLVWVRGPTDHYANVIYTEDSVTYEKHF